ncbi:MAG: hypothetical protein IJ667_13380, partial [Synergistaceae bacterium]|nr:hypothetical protein [Synergistaceae bacterium]
MEINKQTQNEEDIETGRELAQQAGLADNPVYAPQGVYTYDTDEKLEELGRRNYQVPEAAQEPKTAQEPEQPVAQEQQSFGCKLSGIWQGQQSFGDKLRGSWNLYETEAKKGINEAAQAPYSDLLKLEYPAAAQWIDEQRATGKSDKEIHRYLAETEMMSNFVYGDEETNKKLGRTDETWRNFWLGMQAQKEAAYIEIFKDEMSAEEVRDILRDAEVTNLPPSLLFTSPEIRKKAREMAGEKLEGVKYLGAAVSNMIANLNKQDVEKSRLELEEWKQALNDENKILQEAEAELRLEYGDAPRGLHSKEELLDIGRNRIKRFIEWKEKDIKTDEADEKSWRVNVRPSKSAIGRFLFNAIENSGMTVMSGIRSGAAWAVGGPLFGALMTAYNTYDESRTEAGGAFVAAKERGMSDEEAYKQAHKVFLKNLGTLAITNSLGDITTFALSHAGSLLTKAGATGTGKFLSSIAATGEGSILSNIANQIGNKTFAAKLLQQFVVKGIPFVGGAIPEGLEEWLQDLYQMQAVGDEIDYNQLADSFWSGAAQAMLYSMFGLGVNTAVGAIGNSARKAHARRTLNFLPEDIRADFKTVLNLGRQLDNGKVKPDDAVREEQAVFLPQEVINENMRSELDIRDDIVKTLNKVYNKFMYDAKYKLRTLAYRNEGHTLAQTSNVFGISINTIR